MQGPCLAAMECQNSISALDILKFPKRFISAHYRPTPWDGSAFKSIATCQLRTLIEEKLKDTSFLKSVCPGYDPTIWTDCFAADDVTLLGQRVPFAWTSSEPSSPGHVHPEMDKIDWIHSTSPNGDHGSLILKYQIFFASWLRIRIINTWPCYIGCGLSLAYAPTVTFRYFSFSRAWLATRRSSTMRHSGWRKALWWFAWTTICILRWQMEDLQWMTCWYCEATRERPCPA